MNPLPTRHGPRSTVKTVCPHLALQEDDCTCMDYPSHWNLCHRCRPPAGVRLGHQRDMCLTPAHTQCPVYHNREAHPPPGRLRRRQVHSGIRNKE